MSIQTKFRVFETKPRVFITSDIANEPDDAQSLVRYLLYSNEFDTKGIVACTSTHMKRRVCPEDMVEIINAYGQVVNNLNAHVHPDNQYPDHKVLLELVSTGPAVYGMEVLDSDVPLSEGAKRLVSALKESPEPLWVLHWGGANVLAQALQYIHATESPSTSLALRSRIRVYAISDQDDCGVWIRTTYPDIFYICSLHGWSQYHLATWLGIFGRVDGSGPDHSQLSREWLARNIQQVGPLGAVYPDAKFGVEGDSPTFLYLIQNGLGASEHPEWGSWGGRYIGPDLRGTVRHYADTVDTVVGRDGETYTSNHASIWRWREAFQNDFAARMQWTLTDDPKGASHQPVVTVNESTGPAPLVLEIEPGEVVHLDASDTYDPDGGSLSFSWFQYREPTMNQAGLHTPQVRDIEIEDTDDSELGRKVKLQMPPAEWCAIDFVSGKPLGKGQEFHFILTVKNNGTPALTTYKRVVIQIVNPQLRGGRETEVATTADWLELEGLL
ncbi:hypothetical protein ASPCAL08683 [Aspergillus calidoustus]|uniref:Cellulose-binding protein n=1 Tax=Aspergillus calidoustus TaxID=454130 RepID=A0A0U5A1H4_ASPCI|nr:hypothetical protein ASPCAL08683 [Aspergillus calidoustus]